jgi:hypothetical protein
MALSCQPTGQVGSLVSFGVKRTLRAPQGKSAEADRER